MEVSRYEKRDLIVMMNDMFYLLKGEDLIAYINSNERKSIESKKTTDVDTNIQPNDMIKQQLNFV